MQSPSKGFLRSHSAGAAQRELLAEGRGGRLEELPHAKARAAAREE